MVGNLKEMENVSRFLRFVCLFVLVLKFFNIVIVFGY